MVIKPVLAGFTGQKALFDAECYPNYILLRFQDTDTGVFNEYRIDSDTGLDERQAAEAYYRSLDVVMTYNGHGYDDHILDVAFKGLYCDDIWNHGDQIIKSQGRRNSPFLEWGERKRGYPLSIDLAQVLLFQGRFPSLKSLGNRFGYKHLQTLPIAPGTVLTEQQKREIDSYNIHDLDITRLVLQKLDEAIEMRRVLSGVYDVNLTSCWNAKLGSAILEAAYVKAANDRARQDWNPEDGEPPQVPARTSEEARVALRRQRHPEQAAHVHAS